MICEMASRETDTGTDTNPDNHSIFKNCYICIFYILQLQSSTLRRTSENVSQNRLIPVGIGALEAVIPISLGETLQ